MVRFRLAKQFLQTVRDWVHRFNAHRLRARPAWWVYRAPSVLGGAQEALRGGARKVPAGVRGLLRLGVAQGYLVKIDPNAWRIVDNRLYLNYDRSVARTWAKDIPGYVGKADANWPKLVGRP
jgi:hypothetical protein